VQVAAEHVDRRAAQQQHHQERAPAQPADGLGVDVNVILMPPCIFCIDNY
jgi:hypothetical protein